jgi:hypothetical protein
MDESVLPIKLNNNSNHLTMYLEGDNSKELFLIGVVVAVIALLGISTWLILQNDHLRESAKLSSPREHSGIIDPVETQVNRS